MKIIVIASLARREDARRHKKRVPPTETKVPPTDKIDKTLEVKQPPIPNQEYLVEEQRSSANYLWR